VIALLLLPAVAAAAGAQAAGGVEHVFRAGSYSKAARIASLTVQDLRHASRAENINGLFGLAVDEGRVDPMLSHRLWGSYNAVSGGDELLLRCLKSGTCDPSTCVEIARRSELHAEVLLRRADLNPTQVNHAVGSIAEQVMVGYFEASGWTRVDGQVGRTGIDGLFIKRDRDVTVREVLVVESKYNTATLQPTNYGQQMSRAWLLQKLHELRGKYPNDPTYVRVEQYIQRGIYRARLWSMRVEQGVMKIDLQQVHSKGSNVDLSPITDASAPKPPNSIRISAPENDFERALVRQYREAIDRVGRIPDGR
jgi:hypothetical protein